MTLKFSFTTIFLVRGLPAVLFAILSSQSFAEDFTRSGTYVDWNIACPKNDMSAADPALASNGRCRTINAALNSGRKPANIWEEKSPAFARAVLDLIDPIHVLISDLGFLEPDLYNNATAPATPSYRLTLAPAVILEDQKSGDKSFAYFRRSQIYIGVEPHLTPEGEIITSELKNTLAHEYFHAIQGAYMNGLVYHSEDDTENPNEHKESQDWLVEGTAEYVGRFYEAVSEGKTYNWRDAYIDYSIPLTQLQDGGYDKHIFFAKLARIINGRGTDDPGMTGFGVATVSPAYLHKAFSNFVQGPDELDKAKQTLKWFAESMPNADPQGRTFQKLYTLVMRDLTYQPDFATAHFPYMPGTKFKPDPISLKGRIGPGWTQVSETIEIEPVATKFYRIDTSAFPEPGRMGVEILVPEGSSVNPADLHLSVHGVSYSKLEQPFVHNFASIEKGEGDVYLSVSNIAATEYNTQKASFEIRLSWMSGGLCDYETIYASTRIDDQINAAWDIGVPREFYDAFYPPPSVFLTEYGTRRRDNSLAGDPAILPDDGRLMVRGGAFVMGGEACTHHVASSGLIEAGLLGDSMGFSAETEADQMAEDLRYVEGGAKRLTQTRKTEEVERLLENIKRLTVGTPLGTDPRDASVIFSIFSPDLYPFYHGIPAITEGGPLINGRGGWAPNSSGAVNIILPGIKLGDLKKGRTYPAVTLAPEGGASDALPIAGVWRGRWEKEGPIGDFRTLSAGRLTGFVEITDVTSARVQGRFRLRGAGSDHSYKTVLEEAGNGDLVRVEEDLITNTVPVVVSGSFSAPTAVTGTLIFKHIFGLRSVSRRKELE